MGLRHVIGVASLADISTRRHDQLQELADDDHTRYLQTLLRSTADVTVVNTTAETDLLNTTITGGTIGNDQGFLLAVWGDLLNNSGLAPTYTHRIRLGAVVIFVTQALAPASDVARRGWDLRCQVMRIGAGATVDVVSRLWITEPGGVGGAGIGSTLTQDGTFAAAAVDLAVDNVLRVTVQMSIANANADTIRRALSIRHIR